MNKNLLLNGLLFNQTKSLLQRIENTIEYTGFKTNTLIWEERKNRNRGDLIDLLCDYLFLWYDREDWIDSDIINLYDKVLLVNNKAREYICMYLITWNSIEYVNRNRGFKEWEYEKLIEILEKTDRPLSLMVVCARAWFNEVIKWRREFEANDFISVIQYCEWKVLNVY